MSDIVGDDPNVRAPLAHLHGELATVWPELAADADARAIVITGAGRAFCGGGDLNLLEFAVRRCAELHLITTGSAEPATAPRICVSWCSAIRSRTALICTMMSISEAPNARPSASSLFDHGSAVPRTISDQAANELRGESSIGLFATIGFDGSPAQVTDSSCSLRNHIR